METTKGHGGARPGAGRHPRVPAPVTILLRLDPLIDQALRAEAQRLGRTNSAVAEDILRRALVES